MIYVLDTHILIRLVNDRSLPKEMLKILDSDCLKVVSSISAWEIFMLEKHGQLAFYPVADEWFQIATSEYNISIDNLSWQVHRRAVSLNWNHRDPADRWIVSTALELKGLLLTLDEKIINSGVAPLPPMIR